ncbi:histone H2B/H2A fusion protein [Cannes 8 virus]|uniref:Histone doublet H2B-H2A n=2 Tax=Marseillevirus TaxID=1513458 RepID=H2B2A_MELV|nr:conserved histone H2B/H2A fusion protein [Melbournevirus]A0A097I2B5.1 RecName: Full=Histone doublet H2B-H2A; AltName: Full=Histone H2B-H2A fusion protein; AltName: Full=MV-H2B-H2A [Melbournevirus]AGV01788.1 histone H2B/H2A fusion protein [Cannes 8 virus]AIT54982.1 histone H2B/H2A fusion protein [Melbournevirus]AVR53136.1 histone H2B/H2A fusion protein [Marseillevirus Shanghai 1]
MATQKETTRKRDKSVNFRLGLRNMLAQIHPDISVQTEALSELSNIAVFLGKKISHGAVTLLPEGTKTIKSSAVLLAAGDLYGKDLGRHAVGEMTKAVTRYGSAKESKEGSRSSKAKLQISVARSERLLREHGGCSRVSEGAAVALAAAIEYFMGEVLELAGNAARDSKKVRISVKHITLAIQNDAALFAVVGKGVFSGAGVSLISVPIPRKKARKTTEKEASSPKKKAAPKKKKAASKQKKSLSDKELAKLTKKELAKYEKEQGMSPGY